MPQPSSTVVFVLSLLRPGPCEQLRDGLLPPPPLPHAALRHHLDRGLQVEDERRFGAGHVLPLFRLHSLQLAARVSNCGLRPAAREKLGRRMPVYALFSSCYEKQMLAGFQSNVKVCTGPDLGVGFTNCYTDDDVQCVESEIDFSANVFPVS